MLEEVPENSMTTFKYQSEEIGIFPKINNIACLNKISKINNDGFSNVVIFYTSTQLFTMLYSSLSIIFNILFIYLGRKYKYLYLLTIILTHSLILNTFKTQNYLFNYETLVVLPITVSLYFLLTYENQKVEGFLKIFYFNVSIIYLFFNYEYFFWSSIVLFVFILIVKKEHFLEKLPPIWGAYLFIFYLLRILSSVFINLDLLWRRISSEIYASSGRFVDLLVLFENFNCNSRYGNDYCSEIYKVSYGLFLSNLGFANNFNFWSIIIGNVFILIFLFTIYIKVISLNKLNYLLFFVLLSPPVNFLLERMNLEIVVFFILMYTFHNYEKNILLKSSLIFCLVVFKFYPAILFVMYLLIGYIKKNKLIIWTNATFLIGSLSYMAYIYISSKDLVSNIAIPYGHSWTFGFQSLYLNLIFYYQQNTDFFIVYIILISLCFFYAVSNFKNLDIEISSDQLYVFYGTAVLFLGIGLFANFDYRLIILIPCFVFLNDKKENQSLLVLICFFLITSVSPYSLIGPGIVNLGVENFTSLIIMILNQIIFIYLYYIFFISIIKLLKTLVGATGFEPVTSSL